MRYLMIIGLLVFTGSFTTGTAQNKPGNVCYISNSTIYFQIDRRWPDAKKKEFAQLFSLDSVLIQKALLAPGPLVHDSITWHVTSLNSNIIELSRPLNTTPSPDLTNDVIMRDDTAGLWSQVDMPPPAPPSGNGEKIGFNNFKNDQAFTFVDGNARFYLSGHRNAGSVYLSGTFNNWSTMQLPMTRTGNGWIATVTLKPGRYMYKYIIDGRWTADPDNLQKEPDGHSGSNSIVYCTNHTFELPGYTDARRVYLAGSFNNWERRHISMQRYIDGWYLPVYLGNGIHFYKYIVDGHWITDPLNKNIKPDAHGNVNSYIGIGDSVDLTLSDNVTFTLAGFTDANKVIVTGSFNHWSTQSYEMQKVNGHWEHSLYLPAGKHTYKFIVDGSWLIDPANPNWEDNALGTGDSVLWID